MLSFCELCLPMQETFIIGKIVHQSSFIMAENGPIKMFIRKGNTGINENNFIIQDNSLIYKKNNKNINIDDYIKIL